MEMEVCFENTWSEEDKQYFIKHYLPKNRWIDWILLIIAILFFITILFDITKMHKKFTDFMITWIVVVLLIANFLLSNHQAPFRNENSQARFRHSQS